MARVTQSKVETEGSRLKDLAQNPFAGGTLEGLALREDGGKSAVRQVGGKKAEPAAANRHRWGRPVVRMERKGRGGKTVTVVEGFSTNLSLREVEALAEELKRALGTGGKVEGRLIEIQGDKVEAVVAFLTRRGVEAKAGR